MPAAGAVSEALGGGERLPQHTGADASILVDGSQNSLAFGVGAAHVDSEEKCLPTAK